MIDKLGLQMYTLRDYVEEEVTEKELFDVFAKVKAMGYDEIQPSGWSNLGIDTYIRLAKEAGLDIVGGYFGNLKELVEKPEFVIEKWHKYFDNKIVYGALPRISSEAEMPEMFEWIDKLNGVAELIKKSGYSVALHNHHWEFFKPDGKKTVMEYRLDMLDPEAYTYCLDVYWVQYGAASPVAWIEKMKDRISIMHMKEMGMRFNEDKTALNTYITEIGKGNMDYDGIFAAAEKSNVKHYIVEQDDCEIDSMISAKENIDYIKAHYMK